GFLGWDRIEANVDGLHAHLVVHRFALARRITRVAAIPSVSPSGAANRAASLLAQQDYRDETVPEQLRRKELRKPWGGSVSISTTSGGEEERRRIADDAEGGVGCMQDPVR